MNRPQFRRVAKIGGRLVALAAVVFIVLALRREWTEIGDRRLPASVWPTVAALAIVYGGALLVLAEAWHRLICDFSRTALPRRITWPSYALSQPAKYVPGNVFQYVGRHGWMARSGVANGPLLKAVTWDIALLLFGAGLSALLGLVLFPVAIPGIPPLLLRNLALAAGGIVIVGVVALAVSPRLARLAGSLRPRVTTVATVIPLVILFFIIQASVFSALGVLIEGRVIPALAAIAVLSWIVGVMPLGTPAGLGTREAVVLLLAGPQIGPADALLLAALFRLTTTLGDCVCYVVGAAINQRKAAAAR